MPVIQIPMEITEEAAEGLLSGDLVRHGGVIYNVTGGAYEHLKDATIQTEVDEGAISVAKNSSIKVSDLIKNSTDYILNNKGKSGLIAGGVVLAGGAAYYGIKRLMKKNEPETIDVVTDNEFSKLLTTYMLAAKEGKLTLKIIVELKEKLIDISDADENNVVVVDIKQLQALIGYIEKYTEDLAKINDYTITDDQLGSISEDSIINLTKYLMIQEDIFEKAG